MSQPVRIKVVDTTLNHVSPFVNWLAEEFKLEFVDKDPDFIIHSCFGKDVLKYDGVRVCILGENLIPDFNISDYAFASAHLSFGDRYHRLPQYRLYSEYNNLFHVCRDVLNSNRGRFCTTVVSNKNRNNLFFKVFDELNCYKEICSGGRWNNNTGGPVKDKDAFLRTGKFSLVFENSSGSGYVTEKIMHAINAGAIPIYWGAPDIEKDFNIQRIINCADYPSVYSIVERVVEIDRNEQIYESILRLPVFPNGKELKYNREESVRENIRAIFSQPREKAYRRNKEFWGEMYERQLYMSFYQPHLQALKNIRNFFRKLDR